MDKRKLIIFLVLLIFVSGMVLGPAAASHTFKAGKYKATVSDKKYKQMKNKAKKGKIVEVNLKTGKYKTYKQPKYKTKKVTKYKWKYKKVLQTKDVWSDDWSDYTTKEYNIDKYWDNGWTYYGQTSKESDGGHVYKSYAKFKKKVKVVEKKKVKNGYKKVKKPVYMTVSNYDWYNDKVSKKLYVTDLWTENERLSW